MGRGLSEQQRAILIYVYQNAEVKWNGDLGAASYPRQESFGHNRGRYGRRGMYRTTNPIKSEVERASISRSIRRLVRRRLITRRPITGTEGGPTRYLALTKAGRELAEELSVSVDRSPLSKAWQRTIREQQAEQDPRPVLPNLDGAEVREVIMQRSLAVNLILQYEWLGNLGNPSRLYGLWQNGDMLGAVTFGWPAGVESRDICGQEHRGLAICLERGACVHYAPKNAASFLIRRATKGMWLDHGYQIFYAYADPQAGEIGTVYQAVGWDYIGQGPGHGGRDRWYFKNPANGQWITSKSFYQRGLKKAAALADGWEFEQRPAKHKYVWFEGSKVSKKILRAACRYPFLDYPKRQVG